MSKKILVIGGGGREHAMVYALNQSNSVSKIYILPGNAGINEEAEAVNIPANDFEEISKFCKSENVDFVIVGPEQPLVDGIVDYLQSQNIRVFGPNKFASQIEGSKKFMKDVISKYNIPTAKYASFESQADAIAYVEEQGAPIVVKTDGLAAGKGVTVAMTKIEAIDAIKEAFAGKFGDSGKKLVIEEFLEGEELSFFVVSDGENAFKLGSAQDHKAAFDGDKGPNTGGMGTYSPAPICSRDLEDRIMQDIIKPTIKGLKDDGIEYKGFLFAGLMIDPRGDVKLLEYNIRLGDPEAQVLMLRLDSELAEIIEAAIDGRLNQIEPAKQKNNHAICVVMAADGYPESYEKNLSIDLSKTENLENIKVFHAGTKLDEAGNLVSNGGRVLNVCATAENLKLAQAKVYNAIGLIDFPSSFYRSDIGWRALKG